MAASFRSKWLTWLGIAGAHFGLSNLIVPLTMALTAQAAGTTGWIGPWRHAAGARDEAAPFSAGHPGAFSARVVSGKLGLRPHGGEQRHLGLCGLLPDRPLPQAWPALTRRCNYSGRWTER